MEWRERDQFFLPDEERWGRGYGGKSYTLEELNETRGYIKDRLVYEGPVPGYKNRGNIGWDPKFAETQAGFVLPAGFDADSPARRTADHYLLEPNNPTSTEVLWKVPGYLSDYYKACGLRTDQHGRAVHPLSHEVVEAEIPLCTGYGVGYEGGETVVLDTIVTDGENTLFNTRKDHGKTIPSLLGGYTWGTDFTDIANWRIGFREISLEGLVRSMRRIVKMKAGFDLPDNLDFEIVWGVRPWSSYHTLNFWTLTYTVRVILEPGSARHLSSTTDAFWQPNRTIQEDILDNGLWPDHKRGYEAATW